MRVFIVSDTHGRIEAVKKVAEAIDAYRPDKILHLGDYLYNGPRNGVPSDYDPMGVSEILNRYADKIVGVRGNCDSRIDAMLLQFGFEDKAEVELNGRTAHLYHGDLKENDLFDVKEGDIVISGHTHVYVLEKKDGVIRLNPGSPSFPKNENAPSYAVLDEKRIEIRNLNTGDVLSSLEYEKETL